MDDLLQLHASASEIGEDLVTAIQLGRDCKSGAVYKMGRLLIVTSNLTDHGLKG